MSSPGSSSTEPLSINTSTTPPTGTAGASGGGPRLTPKSSFSYSHSPQESSTPGSAGGNLLTQFHHRNSSNAMMMASSMGGGAAAGPSTASSNPVVVTPSSGPPQASYSGNSAATNGGASASGGITSTPASSKAAELKRKPSLHVVLPKFGSQAHHGGSSDSLNRSPHSPGSVLGEEQQTEDKELSYKVQRKNYRREKQRVAQELTLALKDPSVIILTGAIKVRGKLKGWTKLVAVLKPGLLLLYKGKVKSSHWVATVLLHCCKVIERPSKKEGFCFKVFHPLEQSIWATKGPNGETIGAVVQPLPATYLICRAASADEGKCWMDGLELALTCSSLLVRSPRTSEIMDSDKISTEIENDMDWGASDMEETSGRVRTDSEKSDSDTSHVDENHGPDFSEEDTETPDLMGLRGEGGTVAEALLKSQGSTDEDPVMIGQGMRQRRKKSEASGSSNSNNAGGLGSDKEITPAETHYVARVETDFYHVTGEQSEVLGDENRSLLWFLVKQVRPGMDLSRVVLPTFILEPRSFLEKLSDYYYHADLLSRAVQENDAYLRMQSVLRWYLSGFYKKPKGLKKPYNPILGETYRCYWEHPNGSRTFYIAEQVSHHPPVSAFYVSNKKDGYVISSAILAKSKFYGNSTSAILDGQATLTMLPRGETYVITMPYAHCKGILVGTLSMELGGNVSIICEKTGYFTELEFKLKGFLGRADSTNAVYGKIKLGRETIATVEGHWDSKITLRNKRNGSEEILWEVTDKVRSQRLKRFTVPLEEQLANESEKKWLKVTEAILAENQEAATLEKTALEDEQRRAVSERAEAGTTWLPKYFGYDGTTWRYRHEDLRPWDDGNDLKEFEHDYAIEVQRRHQTPIMRTSSLISVEGKVKTDANTSSATIQNHTTRSLLSSSTCTSRSCSSTASSNCSNTNTRPAVVTRNQNNELNSVTTESAGDTSGSGAADISLSFVSGSNSNPQPDPLEDLLSALSSSLLPNENEAHVDAVSGESVPQVDLGGLGRDLPGTDQVIPSFQQRESNRQLIDLLRQLLARQIQQSEQIEELRTNVASIQARLNAKPKPPKDPFPVTNTILAVLFAVALQVVMITYWFGDGKLFPDITRKRN